MRACGWGGLRWNEASTAERVAGRRMFTARAAECFGSHGTSAGSCSFAFSPAGFKGHRGTGSSSAALPHTSGRTLAAAAVISFPVRRQTGLPSVCGTWQQGKGQGCREITWQKIQEPFVGIVLELGRGSLASGTPEGGEWHGGSRARAGNVHLGVVRLTGPWW